MLLLPAAVTFATQAGEHLKTRPAIHGALGYLELCFDLVHLSTVPRSHHRRQLLDTESRKLKISQLLALF